MRDVQLETEGEGLGLSVPFFALSAFSLLLLLVLAVVVGTKAVEGNAHRPARSPDVPVRGIPALSPRDHTVVYLVSSQIEAVRLGSALDEWRLELEAMGTAGRQPRRVVVVQTREEVLRQRVIDFAILAAQAPGLDLEVVDLRD